MRKDLSSSEHRDLDNSLGMYYYGIRYKNSKNIKVFDSYRELKV